MLIRVNAEHLPKVKFSQKFSDQKVGHTNLKGFGKFFWKEVVSDFCSDIGQGELKGARNDG